MGYQDGAWAGLKRALVVSRINETLICASNGFHWKVTNLKHRPFISSPSVCLTPSLSDYLVITLYHDSAAENVKQLPDIMFYVRIPNRCAVKKACLSIRGSIIEAYNIYFLQYIMFFLCTSIFLPCCCRSSAFTLRLTWVWHWHTLCRLWCFLFFFLDVMKTTKDPYKSQNYNWACHCVRACVRVRVCVPHMGGVQTPGANILNLS